MNEQVIQYEDIFFTVKYSWEIWEYEGSARLGKLNFLARHALQVTEWDEPDVKGHVRWDGCMEIEQSGMHFCGRYMSKQYGKLFDIIYDKAIELGGTDD